jgi:hypothetical protein
MMTLSRNTLVSLAAATTTVDGSVARMLLDLKGENASMRKQLKTLMESGGPALTGTPTKRRATDDADEVESGASRFRAPATMFAECRKNGRCINYQLGTCRKGADCEHAHECNKCGFKGHGMHACPEL